nr:hypothetical protein [uncultured Albidiferax sp.]
MYQPWRADAGVVCANWHILICVPDAAGEFAEEPVGMVRIVERLTVKNPPGISVTNVADIALPEAKECMECSGAGECWSEDCTDCDGDGEFSHGWHTYQCKNCEGQGCITSLHGAEASPKVGCPRCDGKGEDFQSVNVGPVLVQRYYLQLLQSLPQCVLHPVDCDSGASYFRFEGGFGWLMGCRP